MGLWILCIAGTMMLPVGLRENDPRYLAWAGALTLVFVGMFVLSVIQIVVTCGELGNTPIISYLGNPAIEFAGYAICAKLRRGWIREL
jgi:hypothetical protein